MGAGMLNTELVAPVNPLELNAIVAPATAWALKAVRFVNVATPEAAVLVLVPPKVQVPWTAAAAMLALLPVTTLP